MSDLIERLRDLRNTGFCTADFPILDEAADTLEAKDDEIERLRAERDDAKERIKKLQRSWIRVYSHIGRIYDRIGGSRR